MAHPPAPSIREIFADRLRLLRKARGFRTAKAFAEALGIDQNTYTRYERGEVEPNIALLDRMWHVLELPQNGLLGPLPASSAARGLLRSPEQLSLQRANAGLSPDGMVRRAHVQIDPPPGFADGSAGQGAQAISGLPDSAAKPGAALKLSAEGEAAAWALAERVAAARMAAHSSLNSATALTRFKETAGLYAQLKRDPYSVVASLGGEMALDALSADDQVRLAQSIEAFIDALRNA